jgi:nucleoside-diphosphate-sugar epimerase
MTGNHRGREAGDVDSGSRRRRRAAVLGVGGLGSQLVSLLSGTGWEVLAVDLRTGFSADVPGGARTALADVRDTDELAALFQSFRPEVVVNTAAVSVDTARRLPTLAVDVNVLGAASAARAAVRAGASLLVLVSCASVYGNEIVAGPDELVPPMPLDLHAGSKAAAESVSAAVARQGGMAHLVVRPPALYGDRERAPDTLGWALWRAARDASTNRIASVPVPATGELELLHAADAARALVLLVRTSAPLPQVVNIGAGRTWDARELVDAAGQAFRETQWVEQPWESVGVAKPLDLGVLRDLVDFEPTTSLVDGLRSLGLEPPARGNTLR